MGNQLEIFKIFEDQPIYKQHSADSKTKELVIHGESRYLKSLCILFRHSPLQKFSESWKFTLTLRSILSCNEILKSPHRSFQGQSSQKWVFWFFQRNGYFMIKISQTKIIDHAIIYKNCPHTFFRTETISEKRRLENLL